MQCDSKTKLMNPWLVIAYVITVLGIDTLAVQGVQWPWNWAFFNWYGHQVHGFVSLPGILSFDWLLHPVLSSFNWFRFLFWFVVPFIFCLRNFAWSWLDCRSWSKVDVILLGAILLVGVFVMALVPHLPGVRDIYPTMGRKYDAFPWFLLLNRLLWVVSWLIGWEFLHRYVLLRALDKRWGKWGWLLVPVSEGIYHLQKPLVEALGMVVFSLVLTHWARKRKNLLLPFLAHLIIEIELIIFQLFF